MFTNLIVWTVFYNLQSMVSFETSCNDFVIDDVNILSTFLKITVLQKNERFTTIFWNPIVSYCITFNVSS